MPRRTAVAMSGGVDSAAAAYLTLREGGETFGATMRLRADLPGEDVGRARAVCETLGIPHRLYDFSELFRQAVVDAFADGYEAGETPNPCVVCNARLKFGALLDAVLRDGAEVLATGHYVRVRRSGGGRFLLEKGADADRDQSYFLWQLSQRALSRAAFPLGALRKSETRELAEALRLPAAVGRESQDACFVDGGDCAAFIIRHTGRTPQPGLYTDEEGRTLGAHRGVLYGTIGQRRGLGIALGRRMYIRSKDAATRRVVLTDEGRLYERDVSLDRLNLIAADRLESPARAEAKIRYGRSSALATVTQTGPTTARVRFDEPVRAPAVGQSCVFYDGDTVIGGGIIRGIGQGAP